MEPMGRKYYEKYGIDKNIKQFLNHKELYLYM
jgi:hypothetical protein